MFGHNLQSMRGSKVWTLKLKSGSFVDCYGFCEYEIFLGFINKTSVFFSLFSDLFLLQMLPLFIGKGFLNKLIWFTNHGFMARLDCKNIVMSW